LPGGRFHEGPQSANRLILVRNLHNLVAADGAANV
jgi:hypothetical protein